MPFDGSYWQMRHENTLLYPYGVVMAFKKVIAPLRKRKLSMLFIPLFFDYADNLYHNSDSKTSMSRINNTAFFILLFQ